MGYLFIVLAVAANAAKGASSKFVSGKIATTRQNALFNFARNILCAAFALITVFIADRGNFFTVYSIEILLCGISGAAMALFTFCWIFAVKSDAYMLVSACSSASFIIPCVFGFLLLKETLTFTKLIAFFIIVVALFFLLRHNFALKGKITLPQAILLLLVFFTSGINQAMQKIYAVNITDKNVAYYTFYTFSFAALILIFAIPFIKRDASKECGFLVIKNSGYLLVMAVGNFLSTYFQGIAAKSVDSIILYPVLNALSLIAGSLMSSLLFKEKLTKSCFIGLILVFSALILSRL